MMRTLLFALILSCMMSPPTSAQNIVTVAGNGRQDFTGDGGFATNASMNSPSGVALDAAGNLFIADRVNQRIRKVSTTGIITTVAGSGGQGFSGDGGPATSADLSFPSGLAIDGAGNLFIADGGNFRVRRVSTTGIITTVVGNGTFGFSGDGGAATSASIGPLSGLAIDGMGNLFIADQTNQRVRRVSTTGIITTVAGNGTFGFSGDDGPATSASLRMNGIAVDGAGNLFIADQSNQRVRRVSTTGIITTVAGNGTSGFSGDDGPATSASLNAPIGVAVDGSGNLFIADQNNLRIRQVSAAGIITTLAGNGLQGFSGDGGPATSSRLSFINAITVDAAGNVYIAEGGTSNRVRKVLALGQKQNQFLQFAALSAKTFGDAPFQLVSAIGSGFPVSYTSSNPAVATVSGSTVTITGAGEATITASQPGDVNYAAVSVPQPLTVSKSDQTVLFPVLQVRKVGDASFALNATTNTKYPLPITYTSSVPAVATVSGNTVTIIGGGTTTITASQPGDANYNAASNAQQNLTVNKGDQTIAFEALATKQFGDAPFTLSGTASSGLAISYSSSNNAVATVAGNRVTITGGGTTTITANQAGNTSYLAAPEVQQVLIVTKADQTITFSPLADRPITNSIFALTATASSELAVTYTSSNPAVATISGSLVNLVGTGSTVITASQAGNSNYNAASDVTQSLTVIQAPQTIFFGPIATKTVGDAPFVLDAFSSANLPISFSVAPPTDRVTILGRTVSVVKAGTVTILADQAGSNNVAAAAQVRQTFCVNPAKPVIVALQMAAGVWQLTTNSAGDYQWFLNGAILPNATAQTITVSSANAPGSNMYTVRVSVDNCLSEASDPQALVITGDIDIEKEVLRLFPNPAKDKVTICLDGFEVGKPISVCVVDMMGKTLAIRETEVLEVTLEVSEYEAGLYLVQAAQGSKIVRWKFMKE